MSNNFHCYSYANSLLASSELDYDTGYNGVIITVNYYFMMLDELCTIISNFFSAPGPPYLYPIPQSPASASSSYSNTCSYNSSLLNLESNYYPEHTEATAPNENKPVNNLFDSNIAEHHNAIHYNEPRLVQTGDTIEPATISYPIPNPPEGINDSDDIDVNDLKSSPHYSVVPSHVSANRVGSAHVTNRNNPVDNTVYISTGVKKDLLRAVSTAEATKSLHFEDQGVLLFTNGA